MKNKSVDNGLRLSISELQQYNNAVLRDVHNICEEENVPYIAMFGTMLGAVRHNGPIPWDYDIDIMVPVTQMDRFVETMEKRLPAKYWVDFRKENEHVRIFPRVGLSSYKTTLLHVDVFPLIGLPDSLKAQKKLFYWIRKVVGIVGVKAYQYEGSKNWEAKLVKCLTFMISEKTLARWYDKLCRKYNYDSAAIVGCSVAADGYKRTFLKEEIEDTILVPYADFQIRIPRNYDKVLKTLYQDYMTFPPLQEREDFLNRTYYVESRK